MVECDEGDNSRNRLRFEDTKLREERDTVSLSIMSLLSMHPWV